MAISILNNIASLAAENQLSITQASLTNTLEQLSSGSRINSGSDDAAGLAIANGLQANIAALTQSGQNASSSVGSLQVADGSLAQVTSLLDRATTLATESSNGTLSTAQRTATQAEYAQINNEINSIGSSTNFNGTAVFTSNPTNVFLSDGVSNTTIAITPGVLTTGSIGLVAGTQSGTTPAVAAQGQISFTGTGPGAAEVITVGTQAYTFAAGAAGVTAGQVQVGGTASASAVNLAEAINKSAAGSGTAYGSATVANTTFTATALGGVVTITAIAGGVGGNGATLTDTGTLSGNTTLAPTAGGVAATPFSNPVTNDLLTAADAQGTLGLINAAVANVASLRGAIGANVNRLQAASAVATNQVQNLTSSEDGILAADIPTVVANLSRYSILDQSGISALAQANTAQQTILTLLR